MDEVIPGYYSPFGVEAYHYFESTKVAVCGMRGRFVLNPDERLGDLEYPWEACPVCRAKMERCNVSKKK